MSEVYFMFQGQVYLLAYRKLLGVLLTGKTQQQNDCSKIFGLEPLEILIKWTVINFSVHLFLLFFFACPASILFSDDSTLVSP